MTFKNREGLIELTKFSDLYHWVREHPEKQVCPDCGSLMTNRIYPTINMDKAGSAVFTCSNSACGFNKVGLVIAAI